MSTSRRQVREAAFLLSFEKLFRDDPLEDIFESAKEVDDFDFNVFLACFMAKFLHFSDGKALILCKNGHFSIA